MCKKPSMCRELMTVWSPSAPTTARLALAETLAFKPEVVVSIPARDKYICDENEYLFCIWV